MTTGTKQELDEAIVELERHVSNQGNTFIAAGLPADFVPQLKRVVVQMVQSLSDRSLTHGKRKGATTSLKGVLTRGRKIVSVLDAFVRKDLHLRLRLEVQVPRPARPKTPRKSAPREAARSATGSIS